MNRLLSLISLASLFLCVSTVQAAEIESDGQLLIAAGRTFSPLTLSEQVEGGLYAHITAFASVRGNAMLFGYFGPELTIASSKTNIKAVTGLWMTKDGGFSAIASLWLNQPLPADINLFAEADAYFPIDGDGPHVQRNYWTLFSLDWKPADNKVGFGIVQENFFSEHSFDEAAIGPSLLFDKGSFWLFYDMSPDIPGSTLGLRLNLNL